MRYQIVVNMAHKKLNKIYGKMSKNGELQQLSLRESAKEVYLELKTSLVDRLSATRDLNHKHEYFLTQL